MRHEQEYTECIHSNGLMNLKVLHSNSKFKSSSANALTGAAYVAVGN